MSYLPSPIYSSPILSPTKHKSNVTFDHSIYSPTNLISANNSIYKSPTTPGNYFHNYHSNSSNNQATSVVSAFRELQSKQKHIENERSLVFKQREELRNQINDNRRNHALWISKIEIEGTENFLTIRAANERIKYEINDLNANILVLENKISSIDRQLASQRTLCYDLQEDITSMNNKIYTLDNKNNQLLHEREQIENRLKILNKDSIRSPEIHSKQNDDIHNSIRSLEQQISSMKLNKAKSTAKSNALQSYIDLIIKINGELCETLIAREHAKAEIMRITGRSLPPHYTWPKDIPYTNILDIINQAATLTANASLQSSALNASRIASQAIINALSPDSKLKQDFYEDKKMNHTRKNSPTRSSPNRYDNNITSTPFINSCSPIDYKTDQAAAVTKAAIESASALNGQLLNYSLNRSLEEGVNHGRSLLRSSSASYNAGNSRGNNLHRRTNNNTNTFNLRNAIASDKSIARHGAITLATRFAAAATAAAVTTKLHHTPSTIHSSSHQYSSNNNNYDTRSHSHSPIGSSSNNMYDII